MATITSSGGGDATSIGGVTPTAAGLALLDDAAASNQRDTLGLGTMATQAASAVAITGGSATGLTALSMDGGASIARMIIDADNNVAKILSWRTNNTARWALRVDGNETGANAGGDIALRRYDDAGTFVANVWSAVRSTGVMTVSELALTTDLAVADGGTGASTAAAARTNLGVLASPYTATPAASTFTQIAAASATLTDGSGTMAGTLLLTTSANAGEFIMAEAPASTFVLIGAFQANGQSGGGGAEIVCALVAKAAGADTGFVRLGCYLSAGVWNAQVQWFDTATTNPASSVKYGPTDIRTLGFFGSVLWLKIQQDSTNLLYSISTNGTDWQQLWSEAKASHITVAQCGIFSATSTSDLVRVVSLDLA